MAALAGPAEQEILAAKGKEMVFPIDERVLAPPISLLTASYADGSVFDLAEERGNIVVLFFMAAWCPTCIPEAHALAKLHEDYADRGVRIIALDVDQNETEVQLARFRDRIGNSQHLWAMDTGFQVVRALSVRALDATVVIDREGRVAYKDAYPTRYQTLAAVVEALLL